MFLKLMFVHNPLVFKPGPLFSFLKIGLLLVTHDWKKTIFVIIRLSKRRANCIAFEKNRRLDAGCLKYGWFDNPP